MSTLSTISLSSVFFRCFILVLVNVVLVNGGAFPAAAAEGAITPPNGTTTSKNDRHGTIDTQKYAYETTMEQTAYNETLANTNQTVAHQIVDYQTNMQQMSDHQTLMANQTVQHQIYDSQSIGHQRLDHQTITDNNNQQQQTTTIDVQSMESQTTMNHTTYQETLGTPKTTATIDNQQQSVVVQQNNQNQQITKTVQHQNDDQQQQHKLLGNQTFTTIGQQREQEQQHEEQQQVPTALLLQRLAAPTKSDAGVAFPVLFSSPAVNSDVLSSPAVTSNNDNNQNQLIGQSNGNNVGFPQGGANCYDSRLTNIINYAVTYYSGNMNSTTIYILDQIQSAGFSGYWLAHAQMLSGRKQGTDWQSLATGDILKPKSRYGCYYNDGRTYILVVSY